MAMNGGKMMTEISEKAWKNASDANLAILKFESKQLDGDLLSGVGKEAISFVSKYGPALFNIFKNNKPDENNEFTKVTLREVKEVRVFKYG